MAGGVIVAAALVALFVPVEPAVADATLVATAQLSPRLSEVTVHSAALDRDTKFRILLPAGYATSSRRYPVLYLLHGAGDDQTKWTANTDVEALTAPTDLIVVMPDAGKNAVAGWYSDWFNAGHFGPPRWESYHVGELIPYVDGHYRTIARREARAVAGLSMGGFGTFSYAARHPDLFVAAASFSGALDTTSGGEAEAIAFDQLRARFGTPDDSIWGPHSTEEVRWRAHNPVDLAANLRGIDLFMATGNGTADTNPENKPQDRPTEAGVFAMNETMDLTLTRLGIPHTYDSYGAGGHNWYYWQRDLHEWLPHLLQILAAPPAAPPAFHSTSAEPSFSLYGWDFTAERAALEFLTLDRVSAAGLVATGSGVLHVRTAAAYRPGGTYRVTPSRAGPTTVTAGPDGRLAFDVDLGPSHQTQQYTPAATAEQTVRGDAYFTTSSVTVAAVDTGTPAGSSGGRDATLPATGAGSSSLLGLGLAALAAAGLGVSASRSRGRRRSSSSWSPRR